MVVGDADSGFHDARQRHRKYLKIKTAREKEIGNTRANSAASIFTDAAEREFAAAAIGIYQIAKNGLRYRRISRFAERNRKHDQTSGNK